MTDPNPVDTAAIRARPMPDPGYPADASSIRYAFITGYAVGRSDVPALCDEADRLRAVIAEVEKLRDELGAYGVPIQPWHAKDQLDQALGRLS